MRPPLLPVFSTAVLLFAAYAAFVQFAPLTVTAGQNQGDTNLIRAQTYLAAPKQTGTVLVGSSLTFRLPASALGEDVANLAMAGGAPATGLALIKVANSHPALVLVEINLLQRSADLAMVTTLLRFPERSLRSHLRVFRTGYDPVNLAWRSLAALTGKADFDPPPPAEVTRQLTRLQQQEMAHAPDITVLRRNLAQAASLVEELKARGIAIGFFEMPVDASLEGLPANAILRREVLRTFPEQRFCWIKPNVPGGAHTLDGIHLTAPDAVLVAKQVAAQKGNCLRR